MPTSVLVGDKVKEIDLVGLFESSEGVISQYYGRIGQGKTYNATADVLDDLARGEVVYTNWRINYDGFDQRQSFFYLIRGILLPFVRRFYSFRKENLHFIDIDNDFLDKFEKLTDCKVYLDEGHVIFDSYEMTRMSMQKRKAVLHTRHFNRSINIISQRPTAVHVSMRANVNVFYKCEKLLSWPFLVFRRTEFQDLTGETVDETKPLSRKHYLADKRVLASYNTKYLRGGVPRSQEVYFDAYNLTYRDKFRALFSLFQDRLSFLLKRKSILNSPKKVINKLSTVLQSKDLQ